MHDHKWWTTAGRTVQHQPCVRELAEAVHVPAVVWVRMTSQPAECSVHVLHAGAGRDAEGPPRTLGTHDSLPTRVHLAPPRYTPRIRVTCTSQP